jgi:hypothetical protein
MKEGTLEERIGFWSEIEKEILGKSEEELRTEMLRCLEYIQDNFGTPKQYYNFSNPKQDEINKKIDRLQNIRTVLLCNEDKTKKIYDLIVQSNGGEKISKKEERGFAKFYITIREYFLFAYGEPRLSPGGSVSGIYHPYSDLKNTVRWFAVCLEKGPTNVQDRIEKYSQEAGKQPESQYR